MRSSFAFTVAALASLAAACGPAPGDAPSAEGCPVATTATPTEHPLTVDHDETWTAAAGPHVVHGDTAVAAGVTLTIEPCARVLFRPDASLSVARADARLVAEGTAARPITFAGLDGARWAQVTVESPGRATIRHATFRDGGGDRFHDYASLVLRGTQTTPSPAVALLDHVTVDGSLGPGLLVDRAATFAAGSTDLVVTRSGNEEVPFPVVLGEHAVDALPTGTYTGNRVDEVLIDPEGANGRGGLQQDATMHDRGVPYRVGDSSVDRLVVGAGPDDGRRATLTIEPGVVLRFHPGTRFEIEHATGEFAASGVLRAVGTAERPVVMTSAAESPRPGDWAGLWYGGIASADNRLEHVSLEYTGSDCGCVLLTCSAVATHASAVIFSEAPAASFLRDVRMLHGSGNGVFRGWRGAPSPDFTEGNTFDDMAGCPQTLPALDTGCATPLACR